MNCRQTDISDIGEQMVGETTSRRNDQLLVSNHLIISKSRVVPTKTVLRPRLEFLAAVINSQHLKFVAESQSRPGGVLD